MGFRNPFRIQVDDNDVAYVTDYSPDSNVPAELPRPGRHGPRRGRAQAVQLRLAALLRAEPPVLPLELQHLDAAGRDADAVRVRQPRRAARRTSRAGSPTAARPSSRASSTRRRSRSRTSGTPYRDNRQARRSARRAWRPTTARAAPARSCSRSCSRAASRRTAPRSTDYDPANPNTTKFPPYYDNAIVPRRVRPGHAARGPLRRATTRSSRSTSCSTAARCSADRVQPFECDNPMDMQFGADGASTC